jgi:hypothetical protein
LQAGIEMLPAGKRRRALRDAMTELVARFRGAHPVVRSEQHTGIRARVRGHASGGQSDPLRQLRDCGSTIGRGFVLATRNVRDYRGAGIESINPGNAP